LATFEFSPGTTFSVYGGRIALSGPEWYSSKKNAEYYWGQPGFTCSCAQFNKITGQGAAGQYIIATKTMAWTYNINYDLITSKDGTAKLTIECSNWRNPILPQDTTGFVL